MRMNDTVKRCLGKTKVVTLYRTAAGRADQWQEAREETPEIIKV